MACGPVTERATATTVLILKKFSELAPKTSRRWQARVMAFKLTYSDGQETDYDDDTAWEVDDGILKMGRRGLPRDPEKDPEKEDKDDD